MELIMNIFKKWKENIKRYNDFEELLNLSYKYRYVKLNGLIQMNDVFLVAKNDDLIFFVKKENWKKYIGISRIYLSDSQGNDFSKDSFYKTSSLKEIRSCYDSEIPNDLIEEMFDELIKYKNDIEIVLKDKIKEEFYK
jgi:hypothetical protein